VTAQRGDDHPEPALQELPAPLRDHLLASTAALGGTLELENLLRRLRDTLGRLPGISHGGVGVYDAERETFTIHLFALANAGHDAWSASEEFTGEQSGMPPSAHPRELFVSGDLAERRTLPVQEFLHRAGIRCYASAPLVLQERLLGGLIAGNKDDTPIPGSTLVFVRVLARLVTPILWNCHTHARFRHGDRRRDVLIELSDAINTSLELRNVLDAARQAVRGLAGHRTSAINLLPDNRRAFLSYRTWDGSRPADARDPALVPLPGTVLEWILEHSRTYESPDLSAGERFIDDHELCERGVRRYVATPMFVRGRIIGCFLMGLNEPQRVLRVDVWLYKNIALQLALAIDNARQLEEVRRLSDRLQQQNVYLREEIHREHDFSEMIGMSLAMRRVHEAIARVARMDTTVLILGETGVGKELVARAIHAASPRADQPMVKVNCAAIPEGMVESELFGHERGAFTSAVERRIGRFELAREGTLFLDEIGELSPAIQSKLLRVLQDGDFERVGGTKTLSSNARIIAATNRPLLKSVESGAFRSDLYYRLNVFPIEIPPLRQRREDIPLLVEHFVAQFNRRMGKQVERIAPDSLEDLRQRDWPGNIRELRHVIERALILCDGAVLSVEHASTAPGDVTPVREAAEEEPLPALREAEAAHIRKALQKTGGVVEGPHGAATALGINPSTLRFRMKRLGIRRPQ